VATSGEDHMLLQLMIESSKETKHTTLEAEIGRIKAQGQLRHIV
jgi:hypothetical protein